MKDDNTTKGMKKELDQMNQDIQKIIQEGTANFFVNEKELHIDPPTSEVVEELKFDISNKVTNYFISLKDKL